MNRVVDAASELARAFLQRYPREAAHAVARFPQGDVVRLLDNEPLAVALPVWDRLPPDLAVGTLLAINDVRARDLLQQGDPVHNARILAWLDSDDRERLMKLTDSHTARELRRLVEFPEETAGALMDTRFLRLTDEMTADAVLQRIRSEKPAFTRQLYLVDDDGVLTHMVELTDLALAEPDTRLAVLTHPVPVAALLGAVRDEIVDLFTQHDVADLAVVDVNGKLVGVIRHSALVAAVQEESTADILSMVGVSRDERALSRIGFVVRKRLPWLEINLVTAFLAAAVVGIFEGTIAKFTALAVLLPVVAGQSGNTGAQALAVTMRGLALREIGTRHWRRVAVKEISAGFINGVAIALTTAVGVLVWSQSWALAGVIAIAMVISMVAAGLAGVVIPIALSYLGEDPAQSSSVILTTVTDVTGFFTFLGIATLMAGWL
jgi:magnesium transporter